MDDGEEKPIRQHITWRNLKPQRPVAEWLRVALLTPTTLRAAVLGVAAPMLCRHFGTTGHTFDPSLLSMLIATPAAFLITAAFQRRERALQDLAEFRSLAVALHRGFGMYAKPEAAVAGQRAVQGTFASFARHLSSYEPAALEAAYVAFQGIGVAVERLRTDPPSHVVRTARRPRATTYTYPVGCERETAERHRQAAHVETLVGRMLYDERTLFTRLESLRRARRE